MLRQLQYYNLLDTNQRHVVATQEGPGWENDCIIANPIPEGFGHFVIDETSQWFIPQEIVEPVVVEDEMPLLSFEVAYQRQMEIERILRLKAEERERKFQEHIAAFQYDDE